ncbi:MAG TPA: PHP domain-containing protein [Spirochaetota bacterium]|nr:PHP domain-containing protein [Spirochaetota bacterium]
MKVDLHCHTTASDGILSPASLVKRCADEKVSVCAIADHDTIDGIIEARSAGDAAGVHVIAACEFSVRCPHGDFHLLGYGIDTGNARLAAELTRIKNVRAKRIPMIVDKLRECGVTIDAEEVFREAKGGAAGKPHVARVLVKRGYAEDFESAFEKYLGNGAPGNVPKEKIDPDVAFELIKESGGVAVCAHPKSLGLSYDDIAAYLKEFIPLGLRGIEAYANMHSPEDVLMFIDMTDSLGLFTTGGSDFHGDKNEVIGFYGGGRPVPESCARSLLSAMGVA